MLIPVHKPACGFWREQFGVILADNFRSRFSNGAGACGVDHQVATSTVFDKDGVRGPFDDRLQESVTFQQRRLPPLALKQKQRCDRKGQCFHGAVDKVFLQVDVRRREKGS